MLGPVLLPVRGDHPDQATVFGEHVRDLGLDQHLAAATLHRGGQGGQQQMGVNGRLSRRVDACGAGWGEAGLQVPTGARVQPLDAEVERFHQLEAAAELLGLVAIEGDVEGATGLVADLQLAVGGELGGEPWPGSGRGQPEAHQRLLAPVRLADRSEHARGDMRGPRAGAVALQDTNPHPPPRRAPGAGQPKGPTADHERVQRLRPVVSRARPLQRHDDLVVLLGGALNVVGHGRFPLSVGRAFRATIPAPALPGSGSDGRRPGCRPLSPSSQGLPLWFMVLPRLRGTPQPLKRLRDTAADGAPTAISGSSGWRRRDSTSSVRAFREAAIPARCSLRALRGGADIVQLREKAQRGAEELIALAQPFRDAAAQHRALFILNDRADLVAACGADGVHVGQEDVSVAEARQLAGPEALVGLSTHSREQIEAACTATGADRPDQISVGPVWATPTKQGRPGTGLGLIEYAAGEATIPWFAIGGIDTRNVSSVVAAGAERIVVVRAIRDAEDPAAAARHLRDALGAGVGAPR